MHIPKEKQQQVKQLFERLKDMRISRALYELLGGWLISCDSREEKEELLSELFDEKFSYTLRPSRQAHKSYRIFARKHGIPEMPTEYRPLYKRPAFKVAAVVLPALILTGGAFLLNRLPNVSTEQSPTSLVTVWTPSKDEEADTQADGVYRLAENETHTLPDNSRVRLGAGSKISHAEDFGATRHVELYGEAHFNITKAQDENDYFTVHTEHMDIKVLGTQFDVHCPAGETHSVIGLYHGCVEVNAGGKNYRMKPTEHLDYDHTNQSVTIGNIPYGELRYDTMPGLVFNDAPVTDLMRILEEDYGIRFSITGTIPREQVFLEGDLSSIGSLDELMAKIQKLSGRFSYEILDNEIKVNIYNHP